MSGNRNGVLRKFAAAGTAFIDARRGDEGFLHRADVAWIVPATLIVLVELVTALTIGQIVGFHYELAIAGYFLLGGGVGFAIAYAVLVATIISYPIRRIKSPWQQLRNDIRNHGGRIVAWTIGLILALVQICVLNWTKSMIPRVTSFWADPMLAKLDRIMFGQDLWIYLHAIGSSPSFFIWFYAMWAPVKFATLAVVLLLPSGRTRAISLLAYFCTMALGILCGQYALPSAGPIFYERLGHGDDFKDLPVAPAIAFARDYLWDAYLTGAGKVGGGISAFPSMHVAMAAWVSLCWWQWHRLPGIVAAVSTLIISLATIYLGWHYSLDVVGGLAIAALGWFLARVLVDRGIGGGSRPPAHRP